MGKYPYFPKVRSTWNKAQEYEQVSTPSNPSTSNHKLYFKSDGKLYKLDSSGLEEEIGGGGGLEYSELTTATTFTPTVQTGLVKVTVDGTDVTGGNIDINIDGSSIKTMAFGTFENRIVNPVSSLDITSSSVSWDLSASAYNSVSKYVGSEEGGATGMAFKSDGTKMYVVGTANDIVYQYSLSSAWDLSTASYDSVSFYVGAQAALPQDVSFKSDGTKMYVIGRDSDKVFQYSLSSAWNVSTASYDSVSFSVSSQETSPYNVRFDSDGTKMYVIGINRVFQYSIGGIFAGTARISVG